LKPVTFITRLPQKASRRNLLDRSKLLDDCLSPDH
jgi:hypothetical protein